MSEPSPTLLDAARKAIYGQENAVAILLLVFDELHLDPLWTVERLQADLAIAQRAHDLWTGNIVCTGSRSGAGNCRAAVLGETP